MEERKRLGMSQADFAVQAGVSRETQINYESGKSAKTDYVERIALMGVDVVFLFTGQRVQPGQLSADEAAVLENYRRISSPERRSVAASVCAALADTIRQ